MASDAPDYQRVVVLEASAMSDAPDWQEVVVGPGGVAVGGGTPTDWPPDQGYVGWTIPPWAAGTTGGFGAAGWLWCWPVKMTGALVTNFVTIQTVGSTDFHADENYLALYAPVFTGGVMTSLDLVVGTAPGVYDVPWQNVGTFEVPASSPTAVTVGSIYYVALLYGSGNSAHFWYDSSSNMEVATANLRYPPSIAVEGAYVALPATVDLAVVAYETTYSYFFAVS